MSTEKNTNEQSAVKRRGPDMRFVIGLIATIMCFILLIVYYTGYRTGTAKAYEELQNNVQSLNTTVKEYNDRLKNLEEEGVVNELRNLTKAVEAFKESYDSVNLKQPDPTPSEGDNESTKEVDIEPAPTTSSTN